MQPPHSGEKKSSRIGRPAFEDSSIPFSNEPSHVIVAMTTVYDPPMAIRGPMRWAMRGVSILLLAAAGGIWSASWWQGRAREAALRKVIERIEARSPVGRLRHAGTRGGKTLVAFREIGPDGTSLPERTFEIDGDVIYVDALVVKFTDPHVEAGDALRGKSIHLFRRLFGERQKPADGHPLTRSGAVPDAYRTEDVPDRFEREIWENFWRYANDPALAQSHGIETAFGEAVYTRVVRGNVYQLEIQHNGGILLKTVRLEDAGP